MFTSDGPMGDDEPQASRHQTGGHRRHRRSRHQHPEEAAALHRNEPAEVPQVSVAWRAPAPRGCWLPFHLWILLACLVGIICWLLAMTLRFRHGERRAYTTSAYLLDVLQDAGIGMQCPTDSGPPIPCEDSGDERLPWGQRVSPAAAAARQRHDRQASPSSRGARSLSALTGTRSSSSLDSALNSTEMTAAAVGKEILLSFFHFDTPEEALYARYVPCHTLLTNTRPASSNARRASGQPNKRVYTGCDLAASQAMLTYAYNDQGLRYTSFKDPLDRLTQLEVSFLNSITSVPWEESEGEVNCTVIPLVPGEDPDSKPDPEGYATAAAQYLPLSLVDPDYRRRRRRQPMISVMTRSPFLDGLSFGLALTCTGESGERLTYGHMCNFTYCRLDQAHLEQLFVDNQNGTTDEVSAARIARDAIETDTRFDRRYFSCLSAQTTCSSGEYPMRAMLSDEITPDTDRRGSAIAAILDVETGTLARCHDATGQPVYKANAHAASSSSTSRSADASGYVLLCTGSTYERNLARPVLNLLTNVNLTFDLSFTSAKLGETEQNAAYLKESEPVSHERHLTVSGVCLVLAVVSAGVAAVLVVVMLILQAQHPRSLLRISAALELEQLDMRKYLTLKDKEERAQKRLERHYHHLEKEAQRVERDQLVRQMLAQYRQQHGDGALPPADMLPPPISPNSMTTSSGSWTFGSSSPSSSSYVSASSSSHPSSVDLTAVDRGDREQGQQLHLGTENYVLMRGDEGRIAEVEHDGTLKHNKAARGSRRASAGSQERGAQETVPVLFRVFPERRRRERNPFAYGRGSYVAPRTGSRGKAKGVKGSTGTAADVPAEHHEVVTASEDDDDDASSPAASVPVAAEMAFPQTREEREAACEQLHSAGGAARGCLAQADRPRHPSDTDVVVAAVSPTGRDGDSDGEHELRAIYPIEDGHVCQHEKATRRSQEAPSQPSLAQPQYPRRRSLTSFRLPDEDRMRGIPLESRTAHYVTAVIYPVEAGNSGSGAMDQGAERTAPRHSPPDEDNGPGNARRRGYGPPPIARSPPTGAHAASNRGQRSPFGNETPPLNAAPVQQPRTSTLHPILAKRIAHGHHMAALTITILVLLALAVLFALISFGIVMSGREDTDPGMEGFSRFGEDNFTFRFYHMTPRGTYFVCMFVGLGLVLSALTADGIVIGAKVW